MEIVTGALPTVLTKLGNLLVGEYNLHKRLKGEIRVLEAELRSMQGALEKVSSTPADQVDSQDKIWASDVRELFYDIEDSIDTFLVHRRSKGSELHGFDKFLDRSFKLLTRFRVGRKIATEIRDIRRRVVEVAEQRDRYKIKTDVAHKPVTIDTRIFARYKNATELVGIDEERDAVINMLMEGNGVSKQQDNIVSIVGFGGLGKTTLANVVYEKLRGQFDCSAFISVSQRPDMDKLFMDMFHQLGKQTNNASIDAIRGFLLEKRYIIIIDDIWDISYWNLIKCALPNNNCGYRIITTTRIYDVAKQVGGAYKMKPLSLRNSEKLFYGRIFGSECKWNNEDTAKCPDEKLAEVSNRILKKCAGVPLAIITIASLLASKGGNKIDWYEVCNSIGTGLEDGQDMDNMRKILSFSFYGMPSHLRTCLLYLSLFPEDYKISKDRLIRMWIAEGFIKYGKGESLLEIGESYFNELINRSVIQPLCEEYNGLVDHCRVHDMMLDLICSISSEENFVTIFSDAHHTSPTKMVRRLSIQSNKVDHATLGASTSMLQVRSVVGFPKNVDVNPALPSFRLLRVLELQHYVISEDCSLKFLGYLLHLRYLGLLLFAMKPLPKEMGYLQFLQTLNIQCCVGSSSLMLTLLPLRHLKSLLIDKTYVVKGIGRLTTLEELSLSVEVSNNASQDIMEELGHLTGLRVLSITFNWRLDANWEKSLVQCLCKMKKLTSLSICWCSYEHFDLNLDGWVTPVLLCRFDTQLNHEGGKLSKLPAWMGDSSLLVDLSVISIGLVKLQREDLEILGRLPALHVLHLAVYHDSPIIGGFAFGAGSFPCLVQYKVTRWVSTVLMFQEGAMPRLAVLEFTCPVRETMEIACGDGGFTLDLGFGNLPSLERVQVILDVGGASEEEVTEVKAAIVHAAEIHPNHPTLRISGDYFVCFSDTDEDSDDESWGAEDEERCTS